MQFPHAWHWHDQDCEVRDYVEDPTGFQGSVEVKTVTSGDRLIPALLNRITLEDVKENPRKVEYEDTYHSNSDYEE